MDFGSAVKILSGKKSSEQSINETPATSKVITATVVSKSENGSVRVALDGQVFNEDDSQYIELDTVGGLEEGDTVNILLTGNSGYGLTPFAIGSVGSIDRLSERVTIAQEAGDIALATNQHFWTDTSGAHVTDDTSDAWNTEYAKDNHGQLSNPTDNDPWHNILLNSLGILLRRGLLNLTSISKSAIAFYDGTGNSSDNITASFGGNGAIIGKTSGRHVVVGIDGLSVYNSDGSLAPVNSTFDGKNIDGGSISGSKINFSTFEDGVISGSAIDTSTFKNGTISGSVIDTSTFEDGTISGSVIDTSKFKNGTISGSVIDTSKFEDGTISGSVIDTSKFKNGTIEGSVIRASTLTDIPFAAIDQIEIRVASIADTQIGNATIKQAQVENLSSDYAHVQNGVIDNATIDYADVNDLNAHYAHVQNGVIDNATIDYADVNDLNAHYAHVKDGVIDNAKIGYADVNGLNANYAHINNGVIDNAKIGYADVNGLNANYAQIDMANVNNAWIANGLIKDAAIKSEMVESISANQLTAGEIDADEITVRNLKASSLTVQTADGYVYVGEKRIPTKEFIDSLKDELQNEIDGAIETFTVSAVPTLNNTPANEWVVSGDAEATRKLRAKHVGDIAYVVNSSSAQNGYCYRFAYDATAQEFKWVLIKDSDVTAALSRLSTAEGKITGLETFESNTTTWMNETDDGLETIRTNHTNLSGRVDKTVVETKQLWFTKSNTTAPNKPTAAVTSTSTAGNAWRVVVPAWNASYPNYYYCLQYKLADGTYAWSDVVRDIAMGESQQQGRKGVADAATADGKAVSAQNTANANIKSSVQLWFTKANSTAPDKPNAQVTTNSASTTNAWNLAIPTYNSSYPHYFYCYQQQKGDGTYQWSDVVYDRSVTEAQAKAQAALPSSTFTTFQSTTFKNLVDTVDEQSSAITQLSNSVSSVGNILSGTVANPSNWIVSAPSGASYAKEAYGTAGVKVTFNSVSGFEWLYSQPIAVTSGNKYMVFFDYTVGKTYTTTSGKSGYGLVAYSGSNAPSGSFDDGNARFLGKAEFSKTASGDRVLKGSFTFTATSDSIILGLNGGQIADNQTGLSFTIDNLVVGETLSTTSTTVNNVKQTADSNRTYLTNLTTTLGTNADGTSKSEDIVHKYNTLDQTLDGTVTRVGKTEASLKTVSNPNLTPYFSHKKDDVYNATSNNDGYWVQSSADGSPSYITAWDFEQTTSNGDGWAHLKANNTTNVTLYAHSYIHKDALNLKPSTEYTFLVEWLNVTLSGTITIFVTTEHGGTNNINDDFFITTVGTAITAGNGSKYLTATTRASLQSGSDKRIRTHVRIPVNASVDSYIRISLYEGKYDGPYKPYVDQSLSSRVSQAETSIEQNATDITLRATKTEAYQLSQPNLSPFFSMAPYRTSTSYDGGYWQPTADNWLMGGVTKLSDGWAHVSVGKSKKIEVAIPRIESLSAGDKATLLIEWRDITVTGSPKLYARNYPDNCQFNLNSYETTWNTSSATSGSRLIVMTVNSTATGDKTWNAAINLGMSNGSGVSFDGDLRISIYEGTYTGPYKPYVDQTLSERVSTAETSIEQTANNVLIKATKSDTTAAQGGQHLIQSLINVAPEGVKIAANHVNIEGAAIFTSGRLSSTSLNNAYDAKGSASAAESNAKAYTDSVEIGGRNLLKESGANHTPAEYAAYDLYLSETLEADQSYVIQLWDVNVSHTGKTADELGVNVYYCGGSVSFGGWKGTDYFTDGHADYLQMTFTPHMVADADTTGGNCNQGGNLSHSTVVNTTKKYIRLYNSFPSANGTRNLTVGRWKLEKGNKGTDWTPTPEDQTAYVDSIQVGGRNLFKSTTGCVKAGTGTASISAYDYSYHGRTVTVTAASPVMRINNIITETNVPYTISFTCTASAACKMQIDVMDNVVQSFDVPAGTSRVVCTSTPYRAVDSTYHFIDIQFNTVGTYKLADIMVEQSNKASSWSLAPEDVAIERTCTVGQNSSTTTNPWYKVASSLINAQYVDNILIVDVYDSGGFTTGGVNFGKRGGRLVAHARVGQGITSVENPYLIWESRGSEINLSDFVLAYKLTSGSRLDIELWCRCANSYQGYVFKVVYEGHRAAAPLPGLWVLYNSWSAGSSASITSGYTQVASTDGSAAQETANSAIKRSQRIYYRSSTDQPPTSMPTAWVTESGNKWAANRTTVANWTTKVTPISNGTGASVTKYLYLWTCLQYQLADDSAPQYTTVLLDDTTTVIDGGKIITGSLSANSINASSGTFDVANIPNLDASKINAGDIAAARIKTNVISAINSLTAGQIDAARIKVSEISIGQSQVTNLTSDLSAKAAQSDLTTEVNQRKAIYGTCSTAAGTALKVVTCANFALTKGARIAVKFTTANTTDAPTLNVNSTASDGTPIWANNAVASSSNPIRWGANATLTFVYDGSAFVLEDKAPTYTVACSTAATTRAKAATVTGALVINGTRVTLRFSTANTYVSNSVQVNFSATGATNVYVDNAATSTTNTLLWNAGTSLTFVRQGAAWYLTERSDASKTAITYLTDGGSNGLMVHPSNDANTGVQITDKIDIKTANKVMNRIDTNGMTLYDGNGTQTSNIVAKFTKNAIDLGTGNTSAIINLCGDKGTISFTDSYLTLRAPDGLSFDASDGDTTITGMSISVSEGAHIEAPTVQIQTSSGLGGLASIEMQQDPGNSAKSILAFTADTTTVSDNLVVGGSITLGTPLTAAQIPSLAASKITSGTFNAARIPNLAASKITSGTLGADRVPNIAALNNICSGSKVVTLSNGKWLGILSASEVVAALGSGASQSNTICIAQNGDFNSYDGVVTGAMGQDGSARAYIYPNHTGAIRINYVLIRFA